MTPIRIRVVAIALSIAFGSMAAPARRTVQRTTRTGRHQTTTLAAPRITTSARTDKLSIVSPKARSRWLFPCGVSGTGR